MPDTTVPEWVGWVCNFSVVKTFQQRNSPDFKFYLDKLSNKNFSNGIMLILSLFLLQ